MKRHEGARGLFAVLAALVVLALLGVGLLWWRRDHREREDRQARAQAVGAGPKVMVARVQQGSGVQEVALPGDVRGFEQITLYAKVAGYLKEIRVDKGDAVKKGQIIGVLESPETDQEVVAARADLVQKQLNAQRARKLAPAGVLSQQDLENALSALAVSRANLQRVQALQEYKVVRAPFDGVVTGRYVDPGALVPAATGATQSALPLVDLANLKRVRVTVFVGQDVAPFVKQGDPATIVEDARPERRIQGTVSRMASALDPRSRTMLTEVWLDNTEYKLFPGTFVHVTLKLQVPPAPSVPAEALFARGEQLFVAVVKDQQLHFVQVEPGLNDGKNTQIRSGLKGGEQVALSLPSSLTDGARVQPVERKQKPAQQGAQQGGDGQRPGVGGSGGAPLGQGGKAPGQGGTPRE